LLSISFLLNHKGTAPGRAALVLVFGFWQKAGKAIEPLASPESARPLWPTYSMVVYPKTTNQKL
jgi:hypothetical protein